MLASSRSRRSNLPHYLPTPVLLDAYDVDSGYTIVGAGVTKALDTTHQIEGTGCMDVVGPGSNVTAGLAKDFTNLDPEQMGVFAVHVERVSDASVQQYQFNLRRSAASLNTITYGNEVNFRKGGRWLSADASEFAVAGLGVGALTARVLVGQASPFSCEARIDALYYNAKGRPTVLLTFDDVRVETFTNVFPLMAARGFKGTLAIAYDQVREQSGSPNNMTEGMIQTLINAGWTVICDSTRDDANTNLADTTAALISINVNRDYLIAKGWTGAENHFVWTGGLWNEATAAAFQGAGFLTGRTTETQSFYDRFGLGGIGLAYPSQGSTSTTPVSTHTARIAEILLRGNTQCFHFHDIKDVPAASGWQKAYFASFLDQISALWRRGVIDVLTIKEWYARVSAAQVGV